MSLIVVDGTKGLQKQLDMLDGFLSTGDLGKVYSRGAGNRRYEHYVQNVAQQSAVHRGRWQTVQSVADDESANAGRLLEEAAAALLEKNSPAAARRYVDNLLTQVKKRMQDYPPPPANSRYIRTKTLHNSWDTELQL